ncbi:conserved hypothetical protein [Ricinus communis]|uniref:Uncharacterized protein n=1 Tax=Ricinus communis TaxID=3988 RepID=B9TDJ4_RICCO|nr:conserved hypothetical protein [Ricinus communis]
MILDLAVQLVHVSNQNVIYALHAQARNRLNAGYMTCYFLGGAGGSWLATTIYPRAGWHGVVVTGVCLGALETIPQSGKSRAVWTASAIRFSVISGQAR